MKTIKGGQNWNQSFHDFLWHLFPERKAFLGGYVISKIEDILKKLITKKFFKKGTYQIIKKFMIMFVLFEGVTLFIIFILITY